MKMEHVALNVSDPVAMATWYKEHLGFEIAKGMTTPPYTTFLRESTGVMMIEVYCNQIGKLLCWMDMGRASQFRGFVLRSLHTGAMYELISKLQKNL